LNKGITATNWPGKTGLIGSNAWVEMAISEGRTILGVICMDTIGYASNEKYSQIFPKEMDADMFDLHKVNEEIQIGNFITAIGDKNSELLTQSFCKQCKRDSIDLPYACLQEDFDYDQCAHFMRELLRSDHAPFWRENIPGMFLTDTGNFRYNYYHTSADTIDKMDFDFFTKVTKAVLGTIVDIASNQ
jgi:aminopeptidase-like protein